VEIRAATFAYPQRPEHNVYDNLNLTIEAGQTVAFVGPSGCGKSTAVQLFERFYDPNSGSILIDGVDMKELRVSWLRQQIGLVSQEPTLFSGTITDNIGYGKEGATKEELVSAAKMANAHDFIMELENGYDTVLGKSYLYLLLFVCLPSLLAPFWAGLHYSCGVYIL
jgi:ATP-binding cassette subfamily B (MDR/TAP) protein 1